MIGTNSGSRSDFKEEIRTVGFRGDFYSAILPHGAGRVGDGASGPPVLLSDALKKHREDGNKTRAPQQSPGYLHFPAIPDPFPLLAQFPACWTCRSSIRYRSRMVPQPNLFAPLDHIPHPSFPLLPPEHFPSHLHLSDSPNYYPTKSTVARSHASLS